MSGTCSRSQGTDDGSLHQVRIIPVYKELLENLSREFEQLRAANEDLRVRNNTMSSQLDMLQRSGNIVMPGPGGNDFMSTPSCSQVAEKSVRTLQGPQASTKTRPDAPSPSEWSQVLPNSVPPHSGSYGARSLVAPRMEASGSKGDRNEDEPEAPVRGSRSGRSSGFGMDVDFMRVMRSFMSREPSNGGGGGGGSQRESTKSPPAAPPPPRRPSAQRQRSRTESAIAAINWNKGFTTTEAGACVGQFSPMFSDSQHSSVNVAVHKRIWARSREMVDSSKFEMGFALLILTNTMFMAMEVQYRGIDIGYELKFPGSERSATDRWPSGMDFFRIAEFAFGLIFLVEVLIKIVMLQCKFFRSGWNCYDVLVVLLWFLEKVVDATFALNPMTLRTVRLVRLVRLARMIKTVQALDSLQVLIGSIMASLSVLFWSSVILLVCQMLVALLLHNLLSDFMLDESNTLSERQEVFRYFGTFSRSMITMFELTLANWIPPCRLLVDSVDEWYGGFILFYKLVMGFAVVKVISGVFLHETFRVAATDDELMIVQKRRAVRKHAREMEKLFRMADESHDGYISRQEFKKVLSVPKINTWLAAMDLEVQDYDLLFDFLDDGDGKISAQELLRGVERLKGTARSIDLVAAMRKLVNLQQQLADIVTITTCMAQDLQLQGDTTSIAGNIPSEAVSAQPTALA